MTLVLFLYISAVFIYYGVLVARLSGRKHNYSLWIIYRRAAVFVGFSTKEQIMY